VIWVVVFISWLVLVIIGWLLGHTLSIGEHRRELDTLQSNVKFLLDEHEKNCGD
jgi:hypothetical protein